MSEQTAPVVRIAADSRSARRASDYISANLPQPYCTGDRCGDCEAPAPSDVHGEGDCCEATCGCCPRVDAHGNCFLYPGPEEGSKYCDQHGEGWPY